MIKKDLYLAIMTSQETDPSGKSKLVDAIWEHMGICPSGDPEQIIEFYNRGKPTFTNVQKIEITGKETIPEEHSHEGSELLIVLSGEITLKLKNVGTNGRQVTRNMGSGDRIFLPAGVAHEFVSQKPASLIYLSEKP